MKQKPENLEQVMQALSRIRDLQSKALEQLQTAQAESRDLYLAIGEMNIAAMQTLKTDLQSQIDENHKRERARLEGKS